MVIKQTERFRKWLVGLKDRRARMRITSEIAALEVTGCFTDAKYVGGGVYEARFFMGPGYRLYYGMIGNTVLLLLAGGDKGSQRRDIARARKALAAICSERGKHASGR